MKLEYEEINGLLYPKLTLPPQNEIHLTRFGRKRLQYLKQYRPIIYTNLLTSGELNDHLQMVDDEANALYDKLLVDMKRQRNITEALKEENQMLWIQEMNNIGAGINEIIYNEYIYN